MLTLQELKDAFNGSWNQHFVRKPNTYGLSSIGFCLIKSQIEYQIRDIIALNRHAEKEYTDYMAANGRMIMGRIFHEALKSLFNASRYATLHGLTKRERYNNRKFAPQFEKVVEYEDTRGFMVQGHVDVTVPVDSRIIEFKTTGIQKEFVVGELITDAYIGQANAYVGCLGWDFWEIWVYYKDFSNAITDNMFSILEGEFDDQWFTDFLDRVYLIDRANMEMKTLTGPEAEWECKSCNYFPICPKFISQIATYKGSLPAKKEDIDNWGLTKVHNLFYVRKWVQYDRSNNLWSLTI